MITTELTEDLDTIAREGARRMLLSVLDAEVTEFLGRQLYERQEGGASPAHAVGYRNGRVAHLSGLIDKVIARRFRRSRADVAISLLLEFSL